MRKEEMPKTTEMKEKAAPAMPDLAAREPAEGDLAQIDETGHLCCPEDALSSGLPVESGAITRDEEPGK